MSYDFVVSGGYGHNYDPGVYGILREVYIFVVLIAMVAIFKDEIEDLVEDIWDSIEDSAGKIY
ncbi:MAG: hypothetical protein E7257_06235 [Lachnospiraceae bacterium]|nr:hypothetical protein [Lachnospiraceae bacterium]